MPLLKHAGKQKNLQVKRIRICFHLFFLYLVDSERNLNWPIFIDFCHDIIWIRLYFVWYFTIMLCLLPKQVSFHTLSKALWSGISRFTTRMRTTFIIKVWITLQGKTSYFQVQIAMVNISSTGQLNTSAVL